MKIFISLLFLVTLALSAPVMAADTAATPNDADALKGVKTGKVIFDINITDPQKMTLYLKVIRQTVEDLKNQGVTPDVILAFRGLAVKMISKNRDLMGLEHDPDLDTIASQLANLGQQPGVRMEACNVATTLFGVDNSTLLDGIKPVGNTFVSLTGYQAQGYANIPIY
ncbi:MAG: DsrE family protein [Magnetovibrio sp.]|nr:DsrE family protein [Magnetovibrio sp.]